MEEQEQAINIASQLAYALAGTVLYVAIGLCALLGGRMTRYQRARRIAFWRGLVIALLVFTGWIYASGLAGSITQ